jgi:hypothetical protein
LKDGPLLAGADDVRDRAASHADRLVAAAGRAETELTGHPASVELGPLLADMGQLLRQVRGELATPGPAQAQGPNTKQG